MHLLFFLLFVIIIWGLIYVCASPLVWVPTIAITLFIYHYCHLLNLGLLLLLDILFIATAVFFNVKSLRLKYLTTPLYHLLKQALPPLSQTEQEALNAGDVYWEKDLFSGRPDWKKLISNPLPKLTSEEQSFLDNQVTTLCSMLDEWSITEKLHDLPPEVWDYIQKEKFWGLCIDKKYGGLGFSAYAHSTIIIKIATRSLNTAITVMVPNSLGPAELLYHYGTEDQKNYYLPRLSRGDEIPCFALTEPTAGSDAANLKSFGVVAKGEFQGKTIIGIKLTWNKRYITLAPRATVLGIAFKLYDPEHLLSEQTEVGITLCLMPTTHPGVVIGRRHFPMGLAFLNGPTQGEEVFVPIDWVIGGPSKVGQGWRMLMECLSIGRSISLPALSTATGQLAMRMTSSYALIRHQFKTAIGNFEGIQSPLAKIGMYAYLLDATRTMTVSAVDAQTKPAVASAITKYHLTEICRKVMDHAMDIHAGRGIQLGPRNYLGIGFLGIPIAITVEGANILTRNLIIFGQGAIRCHPYLRQEMEVLAEPKSKDTLNEFDKLLFSHVGFSISNFMRSLALGLTGGKLAASPSSPMKRYIKQLTRLCSALALTTDVTFLLLGGAFKRKESLSARLGDVLSALYLSSSVLRYYHQHQMTNDDKPYVECALQKTLVDAQTALVECFQNFPNKFLGGLLRRVIFPWGLPYQPPHDKLTESLATHMMQPSELRNRLTQYCYIGDAPSDPYRRMEIAFENALKAQPILKKVHVAMKQGLITKTEDTLKLIDSALSQAIISHDEAELLRENWKTTLDAIQVDDFPPEFFEG